MTTEPQAAQQEAPKAAEIPKVEVRALPVTEEGFLQELGSLVDRAEVAGLNPLPLLARYLGRRGLSALDRGFGFLLGESTTGQKK